MERYAGVYLHDSHFREAPLKTSIVVVAVLLILGGLILRLLQWKYTKTRTLLRSYLTHEWQTTEHLIELLEYDGVECDKVMLHSIMQDLEHFRICQHRDRKLQIAIDLEIDLTVREYRLITVEARQKPPTALYCC